MTDPTDPRKDETMTYREPMPLKCRGVARDGDNLAAVTVIFSRRLSDDELRFFHEVCGRSAPLMDERA